MLVKQIILVTLLLSICYVFNAHAQIQTSTISKSYCTMSVSQSSIEYPKGGYMILTTNEVKNNSTQFNAFVSHKQSKGFDVTVYTEDQYGSGLTGNKAADNIQNWLKDNAGGQTYLLIIANPDTLSNSPIPMRRIDAYYPYPSDYYYADYTSKWNYDNNNSIGNYSGDYNATYDALKGDLMDGISELQVGRIPYFGNITNLDKILLKIITYEDETNIAWRKNCLLPMKPIDPLDDSYRVGEWIKSNVLDPNSWGYYRIYDNINTSNNVNTPIQGVINMNPQPNKTICNYPNVLEVWQNNTIFPFKIGLVHWSTHGRYNRAADVFNAADAVLLDDLHPAIVFMEACQNSSIEFPDQSVGYLLLLNGAIATVGATFDSWGSYLISNGLFYDYNFGGSQYMSQLFAQYVVTEGMEIGRALSLLRFHYWDNNGTATDKKFWENRVGFNIFGCPDATLGFPKPSKAPKYLVGKSVSPTSIMFSWVDNSDDEIYWCIERKLTGQQTWEGLG